MYGGRIGRDGRRRSHTEDAFACNSREPRLHIQTVDTARLRVRGHGGTLPKVCPTTTCTNSDLIAESDASLGCVTSRKTAHAEMLPTMHPQQLRRSHGGLHASSLDIRSVALLSKAAHQKSNIRRRLGQKNVHGPWRVPSPSTAEMHDDGMKHGGSAQLRDDRVTVVAVRAIEPTSSTTSTVDDLIPSPSRLPQRRHRLSHGRLDTCKLFTRRPRPREHLLCEGPRLVNVRFSCWYMGWAVVIVRCR